MEDNIEYIELNTENAGRTYPHRNDIARQRAVNFMPSRQLPHNTLRLRRVNSEQNALLEALTDGPDAPDASAGPAERRADIIVREMELHGRLMEDNPVSEELRREALRDLPQGLTMKRSVRAKLSASVSLRSKQRPISVWKRFKYRIGFAWKRARDRFSNLIFSVELWYEAIRNIEGHLGSAVGSYFRLLQGLFAVNVLLTVVVLSFVVTPQVLHDHTRNETVDIKFIDVINGMGGLEDTPLFYGHYHPGDISSAGPLRYNMPFAYFFTMVCVYLITFAVLCYKTALSYRRNFIQTSGGVAQQYAGRLFCGWDFGIVSPQAAQLNAASLYNEFKELLSEQNKKRGTRTFCMKVGQTLANMTVTALVIGLIIGLEIGVWHLLSVDSMTAYWEIIISLIITAVLAFTPLLLNLVVRLEFYEARTAFYVTLARTWLLDISTFVILLVFWSRSNNECWETRFGQEMYRLVLLDALVSLLLLPAIELTRGFMYRCERSGAAPEFNIAYNSLSLIYNQSLLWLGLLFAPLLVVAVTAKFLLLFYVKKETVLRMCHPARKVWRAAQSQTLMLVLVTLSLFATLFAVGSIFLGSSSRCGPFCGHDTVLQLLVEDALQLSRHHVLRAVLTFITRPGCIAFLFLALCVSVYWVRAKSLAQRSSVALLRQMLLLQAHDKDFLLAAIEKVSRGEWHYCPRAEVQDDSHTWRYKKEVRQPANARYHFDASRLSHAPSDRLRPPTDAAHDDGDTDSSFSWKGSSNDLNQKQDKRWL